MKGAAAVVQAKNETKVVQESTDTPKLTPRPQWSDAARPRQATGRQISWGETGSNTIKLIRDKELWVRMESGDERARLTWSCRGEKSDFKDFIYITAIKGAFNEPYFGVYRNISRKILRYPPVDNERIIRIYWLGLDRVQTERTAYLVYFEGSSLLVWTDQTFYSIYSKFTILVYGQSNIPVFTQFCSQPITFTLACSKW